MPIKVIKRTFVLFVAAILVTLGITTVQYTIGTNLKVTSLMAADFEETNMTRSSDELTVMTWNIAHGRGNGLHQITTSKDDTVENLSAIVQILNQYQPDFVGLQELNAESWWSGNFNHMNFLRTNSDLISSHHGYHVNGLGLRYGTGILAAYPFAKTTALQFEPGMFRPAKGATVGVYDLGDNKEITIVNVHLHWADTSVQKEQLDQIIDSIADLPRPMIVLGDFNNDWDGLVSYLAETMDLAVFDANNTDVTHPRTKRKIDWILVSDELKFESLETLEVDHSDHRPVIARLIWH